MRGKEFEFNRLEDLYGKIVAVHRGSSYSSEYDQAVEEKRFTIYSSNSPVQCLKMLLYNRVNTALVGGGLLGLSIIINQDDELRKNKDKFTLLPNPLLSDPNYIAVAKSTNTQSVLNNINKALHKMKNNGVYDELIKKYIRKIEARMVSEK